MIVVSQMTCCCTCSVKNLWEGKCFVHGLKTASVNAEVMCTIPGTSGSKEPFPFRALTLLVGQQDTSS